jgi:hypothetical protein
MFHKEVGSFVLLILTLSGLFSKYKLIKAVNLLKSGRVFKLQFEKNRVSKERGKCLVLIG